MNKSMDKIKYILSTGLKDCYAADGSKTSCKGSGQDAEFRIGIESDGERFTVQDSIVFDSLTELQWPVHADALTFPLDWNETLDAVSQLNKENYLGYSDWRLPNRNELRSLICHGAKKPALPQGHPFRKVFQGWYWTSTTSAKAPAYAWRVHFSGGRMFYGNKKDPGMAWPVRGTSTMLRRTGQLECFDTNGDVMPCDKTLQDGSIQSGVEWPVPRFRILEHGILDRGTRLVWAEEAMLGDIVDWQGALDRIKKLNTDSKTVWRLPNINELESLVDASKSDPALPAEHPFRNVQEAYWSSTTSFFETDWSYALYMHKGAVGVGFKRNAEFHCWPVSGPF